MNYKLIKWYPSLPQSFKNLDVIVSLVENSTGATECYITISPCHITGWLYSKGEIENNPEFWQPIEEKKPLFITNGDNIPVYDDTKVYCVNKINTKVFTNYGHDLDGCFENIMYFVKEENREKWIKENTKKPIFVTDDGVKIFENNEFWVVDKGLNIGHSNGSRYHYYRGSKFFIGFFSTEELAKQYVRDNKPVFSRKQIREKLESFYNDISAEQEYLLRSILKEFEN